MGAALLVRYGRSRDPSGEERFHKVADSFPHRIRMMERAEAGSDRCRVAVWSHPACRTPGLVDDRSTGSWLALVGNPARNDLTALSGDAVLQRLLGECIDRGASALGDVSPPYGAVFYDGRTAEAVAVVDRIGFQHLYVREDDDATWIASSSLALAKALPSRLDTTAVSEWLGVGNFVSSRTLFREIRKLGCGDRLALGANKGATGGWAAVEGSLIENREPLGAFLDAFRQSLDEYAHGPGLFSELTAGIDSRLILAGLLERAEPFSAWTLSRRGWEELNTIQRLRQRASFDHVVAEVGPDIGERLPALIDEMHELSDGEANALEYAPLLVAFEQLDGRRVTSISGTAGEIARGFFYSVLGARGSQLCGVSLDAIVAKTTRPTAPLHGSFVTSSFQDPREAARDALAEFIRASPAATEVGVLEDLYLRGRLQRFAGRNFSTTGYFCRQGLPYFGNEFVQAVLALPVSTKKDGWVVRKALQQLSPELATVPLTGGDLVAPTSRLSIAPGIRRFMALGRRGTVRYGGPWMRTVVGRGLENVPGNFARRSGAFEEYARDLLLGPETLTREIFRSDGPREVLESGLRGGSLYPLGLLLTLELTFRRASVTEIAA